MARSAPRRHADGLHRAESVAGHADAAVENHRRRGLRDADSRRQSHLPVLAAGRERSHARDRCGDRKSDLGKELRGAVRDDIRHEAPWAGPEIDADLRRRPDLHARHEQHRDGVGCGDRQRAVADAGGAAAAAVPHGDVAARRSQSDDSARRRRQAGRAHLVRSRDGRGPMELDRRRSCVRIADHRRHRRHAAADAVLAAELRRREPGDRRAAVERAVRSAIDDEFHHAARVRRQHGHRVRPGQAADGVHRREQGRQVGGRSRVGKPADSDVVQQRRARRRRHLFDVAAQQRPVLLGRREDRQDAVAVGAAPGRQRRDYALGRSVVRAEGHRRADGGQRRRRAPPSRRRRPTPWRRARRGRRRSSRAIAFS